LQKDGITILAGSKVKDIQSADEGSTIQIVGTDGANTKINADKIMLAAGRVLTLMDYI
jgi:pyruvate/2-oxoglutarate dehydrogenase complex dihydrolipoamide dehydrogenase (E3) component